MHIDPDVLLDKPMPTVRRWQDYRAAWIAYQNYVNPRSTPSQE